MTYATIFTLCPWAFFAIVSLSFAALDSIDPEGGTLAVMTLTALSSSAFTIPRQYWMPGIKAPKGCSSSNPRSPCVSTRGFRGVAFVILESSLYFYHAFSSYHNCFESQSIHLLWAVRRSSDEDLCWRELNRERPFYAVIGDFEHILGRMETCTSSFCELTLR